MKKDRDFLFLVATKGSASSLRSAGYSASSLRSAGYSASSLLSAGYSASSLLSAGYSASDLEEWESIPVLEKPYSTLLSDINEKKRIHKQSTWGDIEEYDCNANVCGTPMCTAGHLVNLAGKIGYDLKKKYGWAQAGALIHYKAHPDLPVQDFGSIPQAVAMAYIETMADLENGVITELPSRKED